MKTIYKFPLPQRESFFKEQKTNNSVQFYPRDSNDPRFVSKWTKMGTIKLIIGYNNFQILLRVIFVFQIAL